MGEAPPHPVQLRFLHKVQKELATVTDLWEHAVSKEWVTRLQHFIEDGDSSGVTVPPMSVSDWDDSNMYIGEKNWKVLSSWYGVDSKYSFRRRSTVSSYIGVGSVNSASKDTCILADNKLDFVTSFCSLLKDLPNDQVKQPYINIYYWECLDYVEFQLRCALSVHPEKAVRMWLSLREDGADVLLEDLSVYNRFTSSVGSVLCERLPAMIDMLQRRQTLPVPESVAMVSGVTSVKDELSNVFVAEQWQLTLCLEQLPISLSGQPLNPSTHQPQSAIPQAFLNLQLDHLFGEKAQSGDPDEELKKLLDGSVQEFNALVLEQRNKVESRSKQLLEKNKERCVAIEKQLKIQLEAAAEKEEQLNNREKELNERDHEMNTKLAKFKSMLTEFLTKKDKFEKETERLAEQNRFTASRVELNVGGVRYTTSTATMVKEEGSFLRTMFKGQYAMTPDTDGSYFIDRDGTNFRYILNFLRDGPASVQHIPGGDLRLLSEIRAEAEFYQLHRMVEALRVKMAERRSGGAGDCVSLPS